MKIRQSGKPQTTKRPEVKKKQFDGSWGEAREKFTELEPLDLTSFEASVLRVPKNLRSYLALTAKAENIEYFTRSIDGSDDVLVVRIEPLKP